MLNVVSGIDMCKILEKNGFEKIHQVGSHVRYVHSDGHKTVIPIHSNEMLGRGLISEILKPIKITRDEYEKLRLKV